MSMPECTAASLRKTAVPFQPILMEQYANVLRIDPGKVQGLAFPSAALHRMIIEPRTGILGTMKSERSVVDAPGGLGADINCKLVAAGHFQTPDLDVVVMGSDNIAHQSIVRTKSPNGTQRLTFEVNGLQNEALLQHLSDVLLVQALPAELIEQVMCNGSAGPSILLLKDGASSPSADNGKWAYMVTYKNIEGYPCIVLTKQYVMKANEGSAGGVVVDVDRISALAQNAQGVYVIRWL
ncbi:MAG: hypothetical protein V1922_05495 [bacterium]